MNEPERTFQPETLTALIHYGRHRRQTLLLWLFRIVSVIVLLAGLQVFGFYRHFTPGLHAANAGLERLVAESSSHELANRILGNLQELRNQADNEILRRQIVQIYERFIKEFGADPRTAISDLDRMVAGLSNHYQGGSETFSVIQEDLVQLRGMYSDHYGELLAELDSPPWYLQPSAGLINGDGKFARRAGFDYAVYLAIVGDRSAANDILNDLRENAGTRDFRSGVYYAQARLLYDAFKAENDFQYFQQALQYTRQSLRENAGFGTAKLFLEYLLSIAGDMSLQDTPMKGEGKGVAEGEKGVISTDPSSF
jgi:hypothetical protein